LKIRSSLFRGRTAVLLALSASLVALGITAAPASAGLGIACPDPISQVFRPWGDFANYAFTPNGGFEAGSAGWTLTGGARVVSGNESFFVNDSSDESSLSLPAGSSATTAPMCVGLLSSKMRFFSANDGWSSSRLKVQVIYNGGLGGLLGFAGSTLAIADVGYVGGGSAWQPSQEIGMLGGVLPLLTQSVQFRFTPADRYGSWQIDDVYLDPLMHR
jgi:hypothetical protein